MRPNSVRRIPTDLSSFFTRWLILLRPYHELTDRQISVAAAFLKERYELSKKISDDKLLDENVMSENTKRRVIEECGIKPAHFQVLMGDLRRHKFFIDGTINPSYIPNLDPNNPQNFSLMFYFVFE